MLRVIVITFVLITSCVLSMWGCDGRTAQVTTVEALPEPPVTLYSEMVKRLKDAGVDVKIDRSRHLQAMATAGRGVNAEAVGWLLEVDWKADTRIPKPDVSKGEVVYLPHLADIRIVHDVILSQMAVAAEDSNVLQMIAWADCAAGIHSHVAQLPTMVEGKCGASLLRDTCLIITDSKSLSKVDAEQRAQLHRLALQLKDQHVKSSRISLEGERDFIIPVIRKGNDEVFPLNDAAWRRVGRYRSKTIEEVKKIYDVAVGSVSEVDISPTATQAVVSGSIETARYFTDFVPNYLEFMGLRLKEVGLFEEATR